MHSEDGVVTAKSHVGIWRILKKVPVVRYDTMCSPCIDQCNQSFLHDDAQLTTYCAVVFVGHIRVTLQWAAVAS